MVEQKQVEVFFLAAGNIKSAQSDNFLAKNMSRKDITHRHSH